MPSAEPDPFPYGVASFEPTDSGAVLWTRTPDPGPLRWEVGTDVDLRDIVASGESPGEAEEPAGAEGETVERTHIVPVTGLEPGRDHHYRFATPDGQAITGRTRTIPADGTPVRLGVACCGDYSAGHFAAYRALAEADVDLVIHLGDYVYAEPEGDLRDVTPDRDAVSRADYRDRYAQVRQDPDLQALHQRHPMLAVIDDHDLADNAHRDGAKTHDPDEHGPWAVRQEAAAEERARWLPIRPDGPAGREGLAQWRSVPLGALGELVLLDTRLAGRDPQADEYGPDLESTDRTILGRAQMGWLAERLADDRLPWAIVVSSVVVNDMMLDLPTDLDLNDPLPSGYVVADGRAIDSDGWDGYPADRRRVVESLRARGRGGVFLSGDVHSAWAFEGPHDDQGPVAVEFTCPAVTSKPMGEMIPLVGHEVQELMRCKDDVAWADLYARGHLVVEVAPETVTATWFFSDSEDPRAAVDRGPSWAAHLADPGRLVPGEPAAVHEPVDVAEVAPDGQRAVPADVPPRPPEVRAAARRRARRQRVVGAALAAGIAVWTRRDDRA